MTAQRAKARRIGVGLIAICATLLSSACAAGQNAASSEQVPAIDGTTATIGSMQLHALAVKAPTDASYALGSDAELSFVLVNAGTSDDTLTGVTSSSFTSAHLYKNEADASAAAGPAGQPSATAGPTDSTSPSDSASPSAAPVASGLTVAAGNSQACGLTAEQPVWLMTGLVSGPTGTSASPSPLFPAGTIQITFTFAHAGTVTVPVPVQLRGSENDATIPELSSSPAA